MNVHKIKLAVYSLLLTNYYGFKLKKIQEPLEKKRVRLNYAETLLAKLNISVEVKNREKITPDKQYLLISNHRGIIDPLIVELALKETTLYGLWISKKELYNSPFFGLFVRNGGAILLDREKNQMGGFFSEVKSEVQKGNSIFIFPEGTRNKSEALLIEFKEGFRIIALKNRLPILPVYIRTHTDKVLGKALKNKNLQQTVTIEIGDEIDYKEKEVLQKVYKEIFNI
ncbi:1-acyl-sn-glycerol-3-phosphate acyltransferase [bacterium]|nr:1-acyl-sn-glycerol-3-phosphate acyltransferase [bacterium]MBU1957220.1 1-acyl-sn-glycerol-3-phosphate acyltransferase [bacterium]